MKTTLAAACLLLLLPAAPAWADPVDDLADVIRDSLVSPHALIAFYSGLAQMDDFDLDEAEVRDALDRSGAPIDGELGQSLSTIDRLKKSGDRLRVERDRSVTVKTEQGYTRLATLVTCTFSLEADGDVVVDDIDGVTMGTSSWFMVPLQRVRHTHDADGLPIAKLTLGNWWYRTTITVPILPPAPGLSGSLPS